jgi:hypothetical protein
LEAFTARPTHEIAPGGWSGREAAGPGDVPLALARGAADDPKLADKLGVRTLDDRDAWLALFAAGAFGVGERRLWIFEPDVPGPVRANVAIDMARVQPWRALAVAPKPPRRGLATRIRGRLQREARVGLEVARIRVARLRGRRVSAS